MNEVDTTIIPVVYSAVQYSSSAATAAKSLQLCPTLCDPIDGSPQGSPVPGILQARTLEWVAISFSKSVYRLKEKNIYKIYIFPDSVEPI